MSGNPGAVGNPLGALLSGVGGAAFGGYRPVASVDTYRPVGQISQERASALQNMAGGDQLLYQDLLRQRAAGMQNFAPRSVEAEPSSPAKHRRWIVSVLGIIRMDG